MTKACEGTPHRGRGSSTIFNNEHSKMGLKIGVLAVITLGAVGSNLTKFFPRDELQGRHDNVGTILGGLPPPLRIWEGKNRPKFGAILRNFTLRSWISPERMKVYRQAENGVINYNPFVRRKKLVNFGPLTAELTRLMFTHPNSTFERPYFG